MKILCLWSWSNKVSGAGGVRLFLCGRSWPFVPPGLRPAAYTRILLPPPTLWLTDRRKSSCCILLLTLLLFLFFFNTFCHYIPNIYHFIESVEIFSAQYFPHERDCPPSFGAGENPGVAREVNGTAASVSQFGNVDGTSDRARTTPSSRTTWHLTSPFSFSTHSPILHPFLSY